MNLYLLLVDELVKKVWVICCCIVLFNVNSFVGGYIGVDFL